MKRQNHDKLIRDYDRQKSKHLDHQATKLLKNQEKIDQLKSKTIDTNFLNLF